MDGEIVNLPNQNQKPSGQPPPHQTTEPQSGIPDAMSQDNKNKTDIFGTVSVGIVALILFLVILNYFNILKFSEIFPNQLGFLPRKEVPTGTSQQPASPASPRGEPQGGFNNLTIVPNYFFLST